MFVNFPGGPVVKILPSSARNVGSILGRGTKIPNVVLHWPKKQKQRWPLRLEDKEMVQKESNSQLVWEFWLFSLSKQEMGIVISSAIPTFVIRDFITYSCQNWHVNMSNMTFQHASDHSKGNYSYWSKEKKSHILLKFPFEQKFPIEF